MSKYEKCGKCGLFHRSDEKCGNGYTVYHDQYLSENGLKMHGYGFKDVAERYAKYYNEKNFDLFDETIEVEIEDQNGWRRKFELYAEQNIEYFVNEV